MNTIGISIGHDCGVTIISDSKIVFAVNEERFTRHKGQAGIPYNSLAFVLKNYDINFDNIAIDGLNITPHGNELAYSLESEQPILQRVAIKLRLANFLVGTKTGVRITNFVYPILNVRARRAVKCEILRILKGRINSEFKFMRVDHHVAHALSIASRGELQNKRALIVTLDGIGEGICSRVFEFENGKMKQISWSPALGSPALMYGYITMVLGYRLNRHEGKITGLAAYGNSEKTSTIMRKFFKVNKKKRTFLANRIGFNLEGVKKLAKELKNFKDADIAAGVQKVFEENVLDYLDCFLSDKDFPIDLYLSGGGFANVKLNQRISVNSKVRNLIVSPNMGDGGLSMGVAHYAHQMNSKLETLYLGPSIKDLSNKSSKDLGIEEIREVSNLVEKCARLLIEGKIIGIARGRMEWGPRALGNRSIICLATNREIVESLNSKLGRNDFMPFAPICRDVDAQKYFVLNLPIDNYKHMTITTDVTEYCIEKAKAVVHVDNTARPQLVFQTDNPFIYEVLNEIHKINQNAILINTSFNIHEEPIVCNEIESVKTFKKSNIDYLIINDSLYTNLERNSLHST
jgi:carbamoyltransferase